MRRCSVTGAGAWRPSWVRGRSSSGVPYRPTTSARPGDHPILEYTSSGLEAVKVKTLFATISAACPGIMRSTGYDPEGSINSMSPQRRHRGSSVPVPVRSLLGRAMRTLGIDLATTAGRRWPSAPRMAPHTKHCGCARRSRNPVPCPLVPLPSCAL